MAFLNTLSSFLVSSLLSTTEDWSAGKTAGFVAAFFGIAAALLLIVALMPPLIDVIKENKTFGLDVKFCYFAMFAATFFMCSALLLMMDAIFVPLGWHMVVFAAMMLLSNVFSFFINLFIYMKKRLNEKGAAALNMSEMDYYYAYIEPTILAKKQVPEISEATVSPETTSETSSTSAV